MRSWRRVSRLCGDGQQNMLVPVIGFLVEKYALLIGVYGGFLFSLLWETKARYVFPYLLFLLPYAAAGIERLTEKSGRMVSAGAAGFRKKEK